MRTAVFLVISASWYIAPTSGQEVPLHGDSVIRFATVEEGVAALTAKDRFVNALSPFDIQCRLSSGPEARLEQLLKFVGEQVQPWEDAERDQVRGDIESLAKKLAAYKLPLPKEILLVKTSGKEEGGAAYCRGPAIVLPSRLLKPGRGLERLLTHELFHVLSSQNPELRRSLYNIIRFQPCSEIALPESLRDLKITNPDGPTLDYYVELKHEGQTLQVVPVLLARSAYNSKRGGSIFQYLMFRLLVVEKQDRNWQLRLRNEEPWLLDPNTVNDYHEKIGRNTGYIIHPDEVLADNFVHLIRETKNLKTPRIVEEMAQQLKQ